MQRLPCTCKFEKGSMWLYYSIKKEVNEKVNRNKNTSNSIETVKRIAKTIEWKEQKASEMETEPLGYVLWGTYPSHNVGICVPIVEISNEGSWLQKNGEDIHAIRLSTNLYYHKQNTEVGITDGHKSRDHQWLSRLFYSICFES